MAYGRICMTLKTFKSNLNLKKVRYHIKRWVPLWLTLHMVTLGWAERPLDIPARKSRAWAVCCPPLGSQARLQGCWGALLHTQGPHFSNQDPHFVRTRSWLISHGKSPGLRFCKNSSSHPAFTSPPAEETLQFARPVVGPTSQAIY